MTDRQIEVLEKVLSLLTFFAETMYGRCAICKELELIIKEQKELNYAEYKLKSKG